MRKPEIPRAGVMGWPITHSLSPRLHGYWLKRYGITAAYDALPVDPDQLEQSLRDLPYQGLTGVNLTVPHKEKALQIVDHIDPLAKRIGAINIVIVREDGSLEGRNSDAFGFTQNILSAGFKPAKRPATILGAGGASRAAITALLDMGFTDIRLVNRTIERAKSLADEFGSSITPYTWNDASALEGSILLVNTTSLGLKDQPPLEISLESLPLDALVTDMVYVPVITGLLQRAKARGNTTVDGLGMLLYQAQPAFAAFYGHEAEVTPELRAYVLEGMQ